MRDAFDTVIPGHFLICGVCRVNLFYIEVFGCYFGKMIPFVVHLGTVSAIVSIKPYDLAIGLRN